MNLLEWDSNSQLLQTVMPTEFRRQNKHDVVDVRSFMLGIWNGDEKRTSPNVYSNISSNYIILSINMSLIAKVKCFS